MSGSRPCCRWGRGKGSTSLASLTQKRSAAWSSTILVASHAFACVLERVQILQTHKPSQTHHAHDCGAWLAGGWLGSRPCGARVLWPRAPSSSNQLSCRYAPGELKHLGIQDCASAVFVWSHVDGMAGCSVHVHVLTQPHATFSDRRTRWAGRALQTSWPLWPRMQTPAHRRMQRKRCALESQLNTQFPWQVVFIGACPCHLVSTVPPCIEYFIALQCAVLRLKIPLL